MNLDGLLERCWSWVAAGNRHERGASLVEYALLLGLIAVVCVVAITLIGNSTDGALSKAGTPFP